MPLTDTNNEETGLIDSNGKKDNELLLFEEYLKSRFPRENKFSDEVTKAIFASGGKRLRPYFTIAFAKTGENYDRKRTFATAAAIEMLHTATLVHDDIIDDSDYRRGDLTVNARYGIHMAVYVGDYLLLKSMQEIIQLDEYDSVKIRRIVKTLAEICTGEIDQYFSKKEMDSTIKYFRRIRRKTAVLFAAACALGAYDAGHDEKGINNAFNFGINYGMAFQIKDDISNFVSSRDADGKPVLNDLADGIVTLPVILAAAKDISFGKKLKLFFSSPDNTEELLNDIINSGGIEGSEQIMNKYLERARTFLLRFNNEKLVKSLDNVLNAVNA